MATTKNHKKNLIVSYKNLSDDLKELFKDAYPEGYSNYITRFVKPNGEPIFVVPFETSDTAYMVKFDVKIDTLGEDLDKALFDDDGEVSGEESEFETLNETREKEEGIVSHREEHLRHGDFEDIIDDSKKKKATLGINKEEIKAAFADADDEEADELDSYEKIGDDDEPSDDDYEPSDEELRGIEDEYLDAEIPPLDATIPEEEMVAIPRKGAKAAKVTKTVAKPAKTAAKISAKSSTKPAVKPAVKPASKPASKPAAKPAVKPAAKPASKPAAKPAVKPAAKSAAKPVAKPVAKAASKPAAKPASKPAAKPASKPAAKPEAKPAVKSAAKPAVKSAAKSVVKPAAKPAVKTKTIKK